MPQKKFAERNLPTVKNEYILGDVDAAVLQSKCRVQDVHFTSDGGGPGTTETFVRIKTHNPTSTTPHFIMRKAKDNYISATSMFRAVFIKTTLTQERNEMEVVKRELAARTDDNASGIWIPGSPDALQLADVYGIRPWIQALLDAPTDKSAYADETRSPSTISRTLPDLTSDKSKQDHTPLSEAEQSKSEQPNTPEMADKKKGSHASPSRKGARARSSSPKKTAPATAPRNLKKTAKDIFDTITEDVAEGAQSIKDATLSKEIKSQVKDLQDHPISSTTAKIPKTLSKAATQAKHAISTNVDKALNAVQGKDGGDDDDEPSLFSATVASAGKSMAEMVAEAREQVKAAESKDAAALAESGLAGPASKRKAPAKRRAKSAPGQDDDDDDAAEEGGDAEVKDQVVSVKRSRVEDLEVGLVREKRKVRALFGLVIGLGATAVLPYLL